MIFVIVALTVFIGDFLLKKYMEAHMKPGESREICRGRILFHRYHNKGMALNFLEKRPKTVRNLCGSLLLAVGIAWFLLLRRKDNPGVLLGLSLLLGGGASNFCDRISKGYVVDYVSFRTPWRWLDRVIFNISDFCIFIGSILIAAGGR